MALKAVVESLDEVPEAVREMYKQDGDAYRLEVEGVEFEDEVAGLKTALEREREERKKLAKALKGKPDLTAEDAEELERLRQERAEAERKKLEAEGKWEELRTKLQKEYDEKVQAKAAEVKERDSYIERLVVDNELRRALTEIGVHKDYLEAVEAMMKLRGPRVQKGEDGYRGVFPDELHGDKPITEYVQEWAKTDQAQRFIEASGATGGGASGRGAGGAGKTKAFKDMSEQERMDYIDEHGLEKYKALITSTAA